MTEHGKSTWTPPPGVHPTVLHTSTDGGQALAAAEKPGQDREEAANLRDVAKQIKARPREIAELIFFEEGGADLIFLTPSREA